MVDTPVTRGRSGDVRYELLDKAGNCVSTHHTALDAGRAAARLWPDQEQDWDRTGAGWDIQIVGCEP